MSERWQRFEKALADAILGELTPGSGNKRIKGDCQSSAFLAEAKWREGAAGDRHYIDLLENWLIKVAKHAEKLDKIPVLGICIANMLTLCLIPYPTWREHAGKLYDDTNVVLLSVGDKKQIRLYAHRHYNYFIFEFSVAGAWIALPKSDLKFLARIEQEATVTTPCRKLSKRSQWRRTQPAEAEEPKERIQAPKKKWPKRSLRSPREL